MGQSLSLSFSSTLYPDDYAYPPAPPPAPPLAPLRVHHQGTHQGIIPKLIWAYWDVGEDGTYPEIVASCFALMRQRNPAWTLNIISPIAAQDELGLEPPPVPLSGPPLDRAAKGDWYRLEALHKFGGVYLDATILPFRSVEHWVNTTSTAVQGFAMPEGHLRPDEPITMSTFAIATTANNTFVGRWHSHLRDAFTVGSLQWANDLRRPDLVGSLCDKRSDRYEREDACYFVSNLAWRVTREELAENAHPTILRSSTAIGRPFHYLVDADENSKRAVNILLKAKSVPHTDMVKLRAEERNCVGTLDSYYDQPVEASGTPTNVAAMLRLSLESEPDLLHSLSLVNETKEGECEAPSMTMELVIGCIAILIGTPIIVCALVLLERVRRQRLAQEQVLGEATSLLK